MLAGKIVATLILIALAYWVWATDFNLWSPLRRRVGQFMSLFSDDDRLVFSVSADLGLDPIDTREYASGEPTLWSKAQLLYRLSVRTETARWSGSSIVGIVFYSADRLYNTESELPKWAADSLQFGEKPPHHRLLHHAREFGQIDPSRKTRLEWMQAAISVEHTPWIAAVYVLPENGAPQWFQLTIKHGAPKLEPKPDNPVQVNGYELTPTNKPRVSAGFEKLLK